MIFAKIGTKKIVIDGADPDNLDIEAIRADLAFTNPEVKNADVQTQTEGDNTIIEFSAKAGRKG